MLDSPGHASAMSPFERYIASGASRHGFWRVILGMVIIGAFWVGGTMAVLSSWRALNTLLYGSLGARARLDALIAGGSPGTVAIMLLTFAGIWVGVFLVVRLLHRQRFMTLFAPEGGIRMKDLAKGFVLAAGFALASIPIALAIAAPVITNLPLHEWFGFSLLLLVLVFIQATAEELIFRGYLLQQLALRSRNPLIWAVLPAAAFGALHWTNAPTDQLSFYYASATFLIGIALAALVWKTGSLWAATGVHVGFNIIGLSFAGTDGLFSGSQLLLFPESALLPLMRLDLAVTALMLAFILSPLAPFGPAEREAFQKN
ncbi:MAG TPA: type II CAAX endopeptidase family protein [Paracoccaceae bacterium]|nr:type II CAAX endopeptidase family protein [Paracoccaceae bacterium]